MRFKNKTSALAAFVALAKKRGDIKPPSPGLGPKKWCKRCSREHRSREACPLFLKQKIVHGPGQQVRVLNYWHH